MSSSVIAGPGRAWARPPGVAARPDTNNHLSSCFVCCFLLLSVTNECCSANKKIQRRVLVSITNWIGGREGGVLQKGGKHPDPAPQFSEEWSRTLNSDQSQRSGLSPTKHARKGVGSRKVMSREDTGEAAEPDCFSWPRTSSLVAQRCFITVESESTLMGFTFCLTPRVNTVLLPIQGHVTLPCGERANREASTDKHSPLASTAAV